MTSLRLLLALLLLPAGCVATEPTQALDPAAAIKPAVDPTPKEIPEYPAVITTKTSELIPTSTDGKVLKVNVKVGQQVKAGEILVELDDQELKAKARILASNEAASKADASSSYAMAGDAARQARMNTRLAKGGAGTMEAVRQSQAQVGQYGSSGQAASKRAAAQASEREETERLISNAKIASTIDGVVVSLRTRVGENATRGQTVARVSDQSDLRVKFTVPVEARAKLKIGQQVEVLMPNQSRPLFAKIIAFTDIQESRLTLSVVEADIDDSKLSQGEVSPTAQGHVRIADTGGKS